MYDRNNGVFVRNPNLYLTLLALVVAGPWPLVAAIKLNAALFVVVPAAFFVLYAWPPFASIGEDIFQRRVERNYRLARIVVYATFLTAFPMIAWGRPDWDIGYVFGPFLASCFAAANLGQHVRFRWLKPETKAITA